MGTTGIEISIATTGIPTITTIVYPLAIVLLIAVPTVVVAGVQAITIDIVVII